jgi:hypothetical protein
MASLKFQKAAAPSFMPGDGRSNNITDKIVLGAAPGIGVPAAGDTLDFLLPAGVKLCDLFSINDALDTGAALLYSVGYRPVNSASSLAAAPTYFAAAGATGFRTAGRVQYTFKPIKFEEDVFITVTIGTAPAGITAGNELHFIADVNCEGAR